VQRHEILPGVWRWTARHPAWRPGAKPESPADWEPDVGSVAHLAGGELVLIDPLVPDDRPELLEWLDELASRRRVHVLTTIKWHRRTRDAIVDRYGAETSRARAALPAGVLPLPLRGAGETMFWLERPRALVPGDRLMGAAGGLRLCPKSWLGYLGSGIGIEELREIVRAAVADLPVEAVLVSHGEPVLSDGARALNQLLAPTPPAAQKPLRRAGFDGP
jgi:hypothetical protein